VILKGIKRNLPQADGASTNSTKLLPVRLEFFPAGMLQSGENVVK
jgi:hypothetical protein